MLRQSTHNSHTGAWTCGVDGTLSRSAGVASAAPPSHEPPDSGLFGGRRAHEVSRLKCSSTRKNLGVRKPVSLSSKQSSIDGRHITGSFPASSCPALDARRAPFRTARCFDRQQ